MRTIANGHNPEWTKFLMDKIPNGHYPEWTPPQMGTIPNVHNSECALISIYSSYLDVL